MANSRVGELPENRSSVVPLQTSLLDTLVVLVKTSTLGNTFQLGNQNNTQNIGDNHTNKTQNIGDNRTNKTQNIGDSHTNKTQNSQNHHGLPANFPESVKQKAIREATKKVSFLEQKMHEVAALSNIFPQEDMAGDERESAFSQIVGTSLLEKEKACTCGSDWTPRVGMQVLWKHAVHISIRFIILTAC